LPFLGLDCLSEPALYTDDGLESSTNPKLPWLDPPSIDRWSMAGFVLRWWLLSRLLIIGIMAATSAVRWPIRVNPLVFAGWDGEWYAKIATFGYEFLPDGLIHSVPFFPLYPLLCRGLMQLGLPFWAAGMVVNNLAFLGALGVLAGWMGQRYGVQVARWIVLVLVWCPLSLFCAVTYTEGLFLLLSSLALRAFDRQQYAQAALWGALTTATRLTGITLIPTFLGMAWCRSARANPDSNPDSNPGAHRGWRQNSGQAFAQTSVQTSVPAYLAGILTATGLVLYSAYNAWQFGNPLAFYHAQAAFGHRASAGVDWSRWCQNLLYGFVGSIRWRTGTLMNWTHPLQVCAIELGGYALWRWRRTRIAPWLGFGLLLWLWLLWGDGFIKVAMVGGGALLLWRQRRALGLLLAS
jgi:hypothetical protein